MEPSKVYFTDMHAGGYENLQQKLRRLMIAAGFKDLELDKKFVCIKLHFGEPGNLAYLRPNWAKTVADLIREQGGRPFLSDANTLYVGRRKDALEHLDAAYENGFNPFATGCQVLIADGLKGTDEALVHVAGGEYVKEAKIGRAFMDADVLISLTHFKGHESTGFGGALKNIGMGCGSRAGKMEMHNSSKPYVDAAKCINCGACQNVCAQGAIDRSRKYAVINEEKCVGCGRCVGVCRMNAVRVKWDEANEVLNKKIAEYTKAVLDGRPSFHVSLVIDVSPVCDCCAYNDLPVVPDVGMFASFDPVALDVACADAVNAQPVISGSELDKATHEQRHPGHDHFMMMHPETNWRACVEHAQKLGIGTTEYELVKL